MTEQYFKISTGLKNVIGSDLITDNFVAVFELVKNSFDARATEVKISFLDIYSDNAKIIIQDNGKGMNYDDLINKWLFVAYSAKRDGSEDRTNFKADYRNKIQSAHYYAGAKGVGRFSCDRLGRYLNLISRKNEPGAKIENLTVDWHRFEKDQKEEFIKIPVEYNILKTAPYKMDHGTVLEISGINNGEWDRDSFKKLKDKLSKLIRPNLNQSIKGKKFKIILEVPEEKERDLQEIEKGQAKKDNGEGYAYYNAINGEIQNVVFDELDIRTTKIISSISPDGKTILTKLIDRKNFIYEIKERNHYHLLANVSITLYFLNQSAKNIFKRKMGLEHVDYGSVFVYKNGFRIYPYGERNDDSLGLDNRALQGYARFLGLRSLVGQIDIQGDNPGLRETTSRDGGLVKTKAYLQLASREGGSFLLDTLKRLEKYAVDVTQWGVNDDNENLNSNEVKKNLVKLIANLADEKPLLALNYNKDIIKLVTIQEGNSAKKLIKNFRRLAVESSNQQLLKEARRLEKTLTSAINAKESAEKESQIKESAKRKAEEELERKKAQLSIVTSISSQDIDLVTNLHHQVIVITDTIKTLIVNFSRKVSKNETITQKDLNEFLDKLAFENSKISSISKFGTRAIFEDFTSKSKNDIAGFVESYIEKITNHFSSSSLQVKFQSNINKPFVTQFRPLDLSIIIDNMISNAKKASATVLSIIINPVNQKMIQLVFQDNGKGLSKDIKDVHDIFEKGFTTTKSTGLGLYHIANLVLDYNWRIEVDSKNQKGLAFVLTINK